MFVWFILVDAVDVFYESLQVFRRHEQPAVCGYCV